MSIASLATFEIRTAGNDTNGGGFITGASGTDYSQSDSKRSATGTNDSITDAVTNNTTTVTSATANFTTAIIGNIIYLTGSGTTTGWYQVTARTDASTITVDRATGSTGGTGVTLNVGGALLTLIPFFGASMSFASSPLLTVWIKAGTYTLTSTWTESSNYAGSAAILIYGYTSSRGDASTKPVITSATNSVALITMNQGSSAVTFRNIKFTHTAATRGNGLLTTNSGCNLRVENCTFDGCLYGINGDNAGAHSIFTTVTVVDTEIKNSTSGGIINSSGRMILVMCWIHDNTGYGASSNSSSTLDCIGCVISNNTLGGCGNTGGSGFTFATVLYSTFYTNGGTNGLTVTTTNSGQLTLICRNNIFYANTGYGVSVTSAPLEYTLDHNAYGANTTAALQNLTSGTGDVTLSGDPVTSSSNFLLNGTAGAGAACKAVGFPGAATFGTGGIDIGAVQTPASTPSYPAASSVYFGVDRGDGVTGTLHASNISTAAGHGVNLSAAILNSGSVVDDVTGTLTPGGTVAACGLGGPIS